MVRPDPRSLIGPADRWAWLIAALMIKGLMFVYFLRHNSASAFGHHFAIDFGDTWSYLDPIESLIEHGRYKPDLRMPGYGMVYWFLRAVTGPDGAKNALVILQWLIASVALYSAARTAHYITGRSRAFVVTFILLGITTFHSAFDPQLATESFCASALIICMHVLFIAARTDRRPWYLLAGILMAWCVFMRPLTGVALVVVAAGLILDRAAPWRARMRTTLLFVLPFVLLDAAWTARNAVVNHTFAPLTNGLFYSFYVGSPNEAATKFVQLYGGNTIFWDERAEIRWFGTRNLGDPWTSSTPRGPAPPDWILTADFNMDSLRQVEHLMGRAFDVDVDSTERARCSAEVVRRLDAYRRSAVQVHPFRTQVWARAVTTWNYLWQHGSASIFFMPWHLSSTGAKVMKVLQGGIFLSVVFIGTLAAFRGMLDRRTSFLVRTFHVVSLSGLFVVPLVFRLTEYRYLVPIFPLLAICAITLVLRPQPSQVT